MVELGTNTELRQTTALIKQACVLLAPIVAGNGTIKTMTSFSMSLMVQQHFPALTVAETHIAVIAAEKIYREERLKSFLHGSKV